MRTFATTALGLRTLLDWLVSQDMTHVAMELTGVYWRGKKTELGQFPSPSDVNQVSLNTYNGLAGSGQSDYVIDCEAPSSNGMPPSTNKNGQNNG